MEADCPAAKSYPPKGENGLYQLHQQICDSPSSVHQKLSVFYYLLLDFNEHLGTQTRTSFADIFAARFAVPNKYEIFMKGLWNMDRQQFSVRPSPLPVRPCLGGFDRVWPLANLFSTRAQLALEDLAHPSLFQEFSDDIVTTLVQNAENKATCF